MSASAAADIVIPVYNEGANIVGVLESFRTGLEFPVRVLICYDREDDDTLPALQGYGTAPFPIMLVRNRGRGVLEAILTGLSASTAPCIITFPADDDYNAGRLNDLIRRFQEGSDIVAASRFMAGGRMQGCPLLKAVLVRSAAFIMFHVGRVPTHDATNGLRLFSRRVIDLIPVESKVGFAYSMELMVKAHRLGWRISEVPFLWHQRKAGKSRFQVLAWLPQYLTWLFYAMGTTHFGRGPGSVILRGPNAR